MTKEQLRNYRPVKRELKALDALTRKIERHSTDDLLKLYAEKRAELCRFIQNVEEVIDSLTPTERTLMRLRYIECLPWQTIAARINYSWQQTHRIHACVLRKIKDL